MAVQKINSALYFGIYIFAEYQYGLKPFFAYLFRLKIFWLGVSKLHDIYITRFCCNVTEEHPVIR